MSHARIGLIWIGSLTGSTITIQYQSNTITRRTRSPTYCQKDKQQCNNGQHSSMCSTYTHKFALQFRILPRKLRCQILWRLFFKRSKERIPMIGQWFNDSRQFDPEAFPKSRAGQCVMGSSSHEFAPSSVPEEKIEELWKTFAKPCVVSFALPSGDANLHLWQENNMETHEITRLTRDQTHNSPF